MQQIDPDGAKELHQSGAAVFVDIRDAGSYGRGHVPGAFHLTDATVEEFVRTSDKTRPVIVYCYHGFSSLDGAEYLLEQGFERVLSMSGGFEAWRRAFGAAGSSQD